MISQLGVCGNAVSLAAAVVDVNITAVCDGCLLAGSGLAAFNASAAACTTDLDCPPDRALSLATALWGAGNLSGPAVAESIAAARTPVLVTSRLLDATQLGTLGAWPPQNPNATQSSWSSYARAFAQRAAALASAASNASFQSACSAPEAALPDTNAFEFQIVPHPFAPGKPPVNDSLRVAFPEFLEKTEDGLPFGVYADTCFADPTSTPLCCRQQ